MGRQAYLAKIAFGRSAFEPTNEVTQSDDYIQLESSQAELPSQYQEFNGHDYLQLYDERGNPINPRSREYGKRLRNAQNDVLAAVGVVERRQSPTQGLSGSNVARVEELDDENYTGNVVTRMIPLTGQICTYWVGTIGFRLLTFRYHDGLPLAQIITSEISASGKSIMYSGIVPRVLSAICARLILHNVLAFLPIERIMQTISAGPRTHESVRRSKQALHFGIHLAVEMMLYPFAYHSKLQRLGLVPARPFLPSLRSFGFFYTWPRLPFLPIILLSAERVFERWLHASVSEAVDGSIIRPEKPDLVRSNTDHEHGLQAGLGQRRESSQVVRNMIIRLLTALGWCEPDRGHESDHEQTQTSRLQAEQPTVTVNGTTIGSLRPVGIPVVQSQDHEGLNVEAVRERPRSPSSPRLLDVRLDHEDPRIRITNREGIVEMEVRLPPRVLSAHTTALPSSQERQSVPSRETALVPSNQSYHRVSSLSTGSSRLAGAIAKTHIVSIVTIPIRLVVFRLVASHYLAGQGSSSHLQRVVGPLFSLQGLSWGSLCKQMSRVVLCSGLQLAIDFTLWGLHYVTAVKIGKGIFGWGTL